MYKDQLQEKKVEKENTKYTVLDEIKEKEVPKAPENQEQQQVPGNPATVKKSTRLSRSPERFSPSLYYLLMTDSCELECFEEAMQVETRKKWEQGMNEEMDSLVRDHSWDLVEFPIGKRTLHNKQVYILKEGGGKKQYKDRLVVNGFAQKKGIYFDEIFSPIVKMTSIRTILSLVVVEYLHLEQLDVKK